MLEIHLLPVVLGFGILRARAGALGEPAKFQTLRATGAQMYFEHEKQMFILSR
ncbi:MAG: hypothetical protein U1F43_33370 [Myxococcota bacterium]